MDKEEWLRPNLYDYPWFLESYPVAFFIFNLLICLFTCSSVSLKLNSISSVLFSSIFIILGWLLSIFIFSSPMSLATFIKKTIKNFWYFFWVVCNFQINPDFCIWTRKNGWAENRMNIPGFYIWTRKNRWAQTRIIIPDFCIWRRKNVEPKPVWLTLISAHGHGQMGEPKTVWISMISTYEQGRIGEPKPVQLSLISGYGQGRMAEPKPYDYPWFLYMDKEEWLSPKPYD